MQEAGTSLQVNDLGYKKKSLARGLSGIIRRVGKDVKNVKPGDRVFAMGHVDGFSDSVILKEPLAVKIPGGVGFEEAATMPICFSTAYYALVNIGQLGHGQSVLIHDAVDSVGQAAIQISKIIGAEVSYRFFQIISININVSTTRFTQHVAMKPNRPTSLASLIYQRTGCSTHGALLSFLVFCEQLREMVQI